MKIYAFVQNGRTDTDEKKQVNELLQIMFSVYILREFILFPFIIIWNFISIEFF
jgi:hypothetical protein